MRASVCEGKWLTLSLPSEPREFQASPLLLPAPTQVPQLLGRAASLLEHHAIQLCQHVNRDCPGDEDRVRWASRVPSQVPSVLSSPREASASGGSCLFSVSHFPPFRPSLHCFSSVYTCLAPCLKEWINKKGRTCSRTFLPALLF